MTVYSDDFLTACRAEADRLRALAIDCLERARALRVVTGDLPVDALAPGDHVVQMAPANGAVDLGAPLVTPPIAAEDRSHEHDADALTGAGDRPGEQKDAPPPAPRPGERKDGGQRPGEQKDGPAAPPPAQTPRSDAEGRRLRPDGSPMRPDEIKAADRRDRVLAWVNEQWDVVAHDVAKALGIKGADAAVDLRRLTNEARIIKTDTKRRGRAQERGATAPVYHALVRSKSHPDRPADEADADPAPSGAQHRKPLPDRVTDERIRDAIVDLSDHGKQTFTRRQVAKALAISQEQARYVLEQWQAGGRVERTGDTNGTTVWKYLSAHGSTGDGPLGPVGESAIERAALDAAGIDPADRGLPPGRGGIEGTGKNGLLRGASEAVKKLADDVERAGGVIDGASNGHLVAIGPKGRGQFAKTPGSGTLTQTRKHLKRVTGLEIPAR